METQTLTLTEFLLARIAEDKARWATAVPPWTAPHDPDCDYPGDMPGLCTCTLLDRLKADCEAKRRIVEDYGFRESGRSSLSIFGERILGYLALPYADHPDYRDEWRP